MKEATDEAEMEQAYTTERHLLYVSCTLSRDDLFVTGIKPVSWLLDGPTQG